MSEYKKKLVKQIGEAESQRDRALEVFFDGTKPLEERLAAFQKSGTFDKDENIAKALEILRDGDQEERLRAASLKGLVARVSTDEELMAEVIKIIGESKSPTALKHAALTVMQTASIGSPIYQSQRAAYFDAMRGLIEHDDAPVRTSAQEYLALEGDEYLQRRLLEGINEPTKKIAEPEVAVQLLSYDLHADHFPILRKLVENPPNERSKKEALRNLAADTSAKELLLKTLKDGKESREIREVCMAALQAQNAPELASYAKEVILTEAEDDELRATMLNALSYISGAEPLDGEFERQLEHVQETSSSESLKKVYRQYRMNQNQQRK